MSPRKSLSLAAAALTGLLATASSLAPAASAAPTADPAWAPAAEASIHPGVQMYTEGGQCTGNFVFADDAGNTYVGYAAHCAGTGAATDTDGCLADSLPLGTRVTFREGGNLLGEGTQVGAGTLAYSSWLTMDRRGESDANTCAYNDFALVRVDEADVAKVNPSVPVFGGPVGIDRDGTAAGDRVLTFGNSSLRAGIELLSPHVGISLGDDPATDGWTHPLYTVTPGVPGDSGSGFLNGEGEAVGTLSTLGLLPLPLSNNIGDLGRELDYAQQHSGLAGLRLVHGTEPFRSLL